MKFFATFLENRPPPYSTYFMTCPLNRPDFWINCRVSRSMFLSSSLGKFNHHVIKSALEHYSRDLYIQINRRNK